MPRRYPETSGSKKPMKAKNQERAYIAASRRSDRSLEARVASARLASEIHKKRTGKGFKITEEIVSKEEMYEEEEDDLPMSIRASLGSLHTSSAHFNARMDAYVAKHMGMAQMARELEIGQQFEQHFPGFSSMHSRARMMQQQQQMQQQQAQYHQGVQPQQQMMPQHTRHLSYAQQDLPSRDFSQSPTSDAHSQFQSPVTRTTSLSEASCSPQASYVRRHTVTADGMDNSADIERMRMMSCQRHNSNETVSTPALTTASGAESPQAHLQTPEMNVANTYMTTDSLRPMVPTAPIVNGNSVFTSQLPANVEQMLSGPWVDYSMTYHQSSVDESQSPLTASHGDLDMDQLPEWLRTDPDQKTHHSYLDTTSAEVHGCSDAFSSPIGVNHMFPGDGTFGVTDGIGEDVNYNLEEMDMDQYFNFESFNTISAQSQS
ncbi:hypothetical protein PpBr36_04331 [Pyricularia pennisetigena]|uniref:hypothetical protein n=1 Tax=Pyricularia pennisetigena TaxID=1578925 RepID=UPI00115380B8|nr:hypothetical protein PpBr36_04331 [Pyricularia pennisetigena]TLS27293.1 hypothetical protein PpBr36_04331 [Pyricularia pennisetigena]